MGGNLMLSNGQRPDKMNKKEMKRFLKFIDNNIIPTKEYKRAGSCKNYNLYDDDHLFGDADIFMFNYEYNLLPEILKYVNNVVAQKIGKKRSSVVFNFKNKNFQADFICIEPASEYSDFGMFHVSTFDAWAHSSDPKDAKIGLKGVALKILMRAITGIELIGLEDGTVTNMYAFSVDYGLRKKYELDEDDYTFKKIKPEYTEYETDVNEIFKTFNIHIGWQYQNSFIDVAYMIKKNHPIKHKHIKECLVKLLNDCQSFDSDITKSNELKSRMIEVFSNPECYFVKDV